MIYYVNLCDLLRGCDWFGQVLQLVNDVLHSHHDSAADLHGVSSLADGVETLLGDGTSQHCGGSGAVAGLLIGVVGHVLHQLGANVLVLVLQVDALGHRHTVLGDLRAAPCLLDDDSATLEQRESGQSVLNYILNRTKQWIQHKISNLVLPLDPW